MENHEDEEEADMQCPVCEEQHDIGDCGEFLKLFLEDRNKMVFKKRLCYGCYESVSKNHNAKDCAKKRTCKIYQKKHSKNLHGFGKKKKVDGKNDTDKTNDDDEKELPDSGDKSCSSVNMESKSVCNSVVPVAIGHENSKKLISTYALLDNCSEGIFISKNLLCQMGINCKPSS